MTAPNGAAWRILNGDVRAALNEAMTAELVPWAIDDR